MNKSIELAKRLEGLHTVDTMAKTLNVKKSTAVNIAHNLRKMGYLKSFGGGKQVRFYKITTKKDLKIGNPGFYEIINKYSRIKIAPKYEYKVIGKKLTIEEALIRAIKTRDIRIIIASLELFNHIRDWSLLYQLAKKEIIGRYVGALYDAARNIIRVRRIDKRIRKKLQNSRIKSKFIVPLIKSKDLKDIEKLWNVYLPFNKSDLMRYKE